jgi:serine/threonine protein kinase
LKKRKKLKPKKMITVNSRRRKDPRKSKTTGNREDNVPEDFMQSYSKRNRSKTLSSRKPVPNPEAFALTEKKRLKHDDDDDEDIENTHPFDLININFLKAPNTPVKRSLSDEERTQKERYDAEISYRFTSKIAIAQTKTSTVFRVTDTSGTIYALKELNTCFLSKKKELQKAALIEYKHAKSLRHHPNILRYDTYWQFGPYICFQMEYIPGSSLERYLRENSLYDTVLGHEKEIVWKFLFDLLNGLSYMHQKNIVHLDIKPSNILLCPRSANNNIPTLKIGDFGLSRILGGSESGDERFKKGDGKYLAPELLDSKSCITTAVDIFSLGITVYEMASDYTASDVLWTSVINDTISYDKISKDLKILLARMLCKEPAFRISAADCLLLNDKLRNLHNEYGCDFATLNNNDDSNEEMEDVYSGLDPQMTQSQSAQSYSKIGFSTTNEESIKPNLVAIRKKLF